MDDIDVVLVQGYQGVQSISIDKEAAEKIEIKLSNNSMELSLQKHAKRNRQLVYVYVS